VEEEVECNPPKRERGLSTSLATSSGGDQTCLLHFAGKSAILPKKGKEHREPDNLKERE
jgi:hypothetical protein